jgi:hypothetical protein
MARSNGIHIVVNADPRDHPILAAFTVKKEMIVWLGKMVERGDLTPETDWHVVRTGDGIFQKAPTHEGAPRAYDLWAATLQFNLRDQT